MASDVEALLARVAGEHSWNWATLQCTCGAQALKVAPIGDASFEESHIIAVQAAALRKWLTAPEQVERAAGAIHRHMQAVRDRGDYIVGPASDEAAQDALAALADAIGGDQ
jgi:hypothetical protein